MGLVLGVYGEEVWGQAVTAALASILSSFSKDKALPAAVQQQNLSVSENGVRKSERKPVAEPLSCADDVKALSSRTPHSHLAAADPGDSGEEVTELQAQTELGGGVLPRTCVQNFVHKRKSEED